MYLRNWAPLLKPCAAICTGILICGLPIAVLAVEFKPIRRGLPGRREGAGTRGPACVQDVRPLTTLVPQTNLGLTISEYPQFFWYVPKTRAKTATFALFRGNDQDPQQSLIYETTINILHSGTVMNFVLPKSQQLPPLVLNQDYYWSIILNCNTDDLFVNPRAEGWVQRVAISNSLKQQLSRAKPGDRPQIFAQNQLWFDTVSSLASLRCEHSSDSALLASWKQLLKSVQLDKIAEQPVHHKCL
jgi:Domain of Unknown Function (DUF928)